VKKEIRTLGGVVYKICRGRKRMSAVNVDGRMTVGWSETIEAPLNEFFPSNVREQCGSTDGETAGGEEFDWDEVRMAVRKMRNGRVPGMDGVIAEMMKGM